MPQNKNAAFRPRFENVDFGGAERDRTDDLLSAIQALSQLSYSPTMLESIEANGSLPG